MIYIFLILVNIGYFLWNSVLLFLIIFVKLNECELNISGKKIKKIVDKWLDRRLLFFICEGIVVNFFELERIKILVF